MKIDTDIIQILATAKIEGNRLSVPYLLERDLYAKLNKVLVALGGKWEKRMKAHVFERDIAEVVEQAIQTGEVVDLKRDFDFFQTPEDLAVRMARLIAPQKGQTILEPSAGRGRLAYAVLNLEKSVTLHLVEKAEDNIAYLKAMFLKPVATDFMAYAPRCRYDAILANPPFSKRQDARHLAHMLDLLKDGGKLVCVVSGSFAWRNDIVTMELRERIVRLGGVIEPLPEGTFKAEGTMVNAAMVKII